MDAARHEKSERKTEYRYKRRCGGKDGRGVQEKTAARSADARDQRTRLDTRKANEKTESRYKRRCGGKDGRGVQEKTAAAQRRRARSMDVARHEKSERKN